MSSGRGSGCPAAPHSADEEPLEELRFLADAELRECLGEYPDFVYHLARDRRGRLYLRTIRTLLLDRVLCSNRVSQMTKTYNDIEAVTRLLEEKEKDLELTARIGKELLTANERLETNSAALEVELKEARDKITQLLYELTSKTQLIHILTNDAEGAGTPDDEPDGNPSGLGPATFDLLRRRVGSLERENRELRDETFRLVEDADGAEDAERRLLTEFTNQLATANMDVDSLESELAKQKEDCRQHTEQLQFTSQRLQLTEQRLIEITGEHEHSSQLLEITRENQNALANELGEFKERYAELMTHLSSAQEQLRALRRRGAPMARGGSLMPYVAAAAGIGHHDSLQSELESSVYSDLSLDSGISEGNRGPSYKKVFETVKYATHNSNPSTVQESSSDTGLVWLSGGPAYGGSVSAVPRISTFSVDSVLDGCSVADSTEEYPGAPVGVPGVPGAADLAAALRRLTHAEVAARRATLASGPLYSHYDYDGGRSSPVPLHSNIPYGIRTPDSIMSTGSGSQLLNRRPPPSTQSSFHNISPWRLPDKLQIVKPLEGSQTLHQWAQLATPTMSGLLEERPGVQIRGGRNPGDLGVHVYSLDDVEEDDDYPGKRFPGSSHVFTMTNSMVMHPDDGSRANSVLGSAAASGFNSALTSEWGSAASSRVMSARHSPTRTLSRKNSTCTFTTDLGLAQMLRDRGFTATWSPTATPANSPLLGSPDSSPLDTPTCSPPPEAIDPSEPLAIRSLIAGGTNIMRGANAHRGKPSNATLSPLTLQASGMLLTNRIRQSPMAQLTCFKQALYGSAVKSRLAPVVERESEPSADISKDKSVLIRPKAVTSEGRPEKRQRPSADGRRPRPRGDLGTVGIRPSTAAAPPKTAGGGYSTLGTLSSLLFGRKGGLL